MFFDLRLRRNNEKKNRTIRRLRALMKRDALTLLTTTTTYKKEIQYFSKRFMRPRGEKLFTCGAGVGSGCVDPYGKFHSCLLMRDPACCYDLTQGTLKDALAGLFPKLRMIKAKNEDYLRRCARCFLGSLCEQCPARSWIEHGTLDTPVEYQCSIAHEKARILGLVKKTETAWTVTDWEKRLERFRLQ